MSHYWGEGTGNPMPRTLVFPDAHAAMTPGSDATIDRLLARAEAAANRAAADPAQWQAGVQALADAVGADGASLFVPAPAPRGGVIAAVGHQVPGAKDYFEYWIRRDPWNLAPHAGRLFRVAGEVRFGAEYLSDDDYRRTDYHNDYARFMDVGHKLFVKVCDEADPVAPVTHLSFSRSFRHEAFGDAERRRVLSVWPALQRAVQAYWMLHRAQQVRELGHAALGALPGAAWVLRADGRVDHANAEAEALSRSAGWLRVADGRLVQLGDLDAAGLRRLVAQPAGARRLVACGDALVGTLRRGTLRVVPIAESPLHAAAWPHAAALLMLEWPQADDDERWVLVHLRPQYRLTLAECRVLVRLASGEDAETIAARLNVEASTVKSHLRALREKTGRRSQAALVRLALGR